MYHTLRRSSGAAHGLTHPKMAGGSVQIALQPLDLQGLGCGVVVGKGIPGTAEHAPARRLCESTAQNLDESVLGERRESRTRSTGRLSGRGRLRGQTGPPQKTGCLLRTFGTMDPGVSVVAREAPKSVSQLVALARSLVFPNPSRTRHGSASSTHFPCNLACEAASPQSEARRSSSAIRTQEDKQTGVTTTPQSPRDPPASLRSCLRPLTSRSLLRSWLQDPMNGADLAWFAVWSACLAWRARSIAYQQQLHPPGLGACPSPCAHDRKKKSVRALLTSWSSGSWNLCQYS